MDDYKKEIVLSFKKHLKDDDIFILKSNLEKVKGIESINIATQSVSIEYVSLHLTEEMVKEIIKDAGYPLRELKKRRKGFFRRFIDDLARSNRESFGNKKLDCCDLKQKNSK
ncbi:heavy-metal-associated domain-containing protein [Geofilum rubicundum]|uniref:HMA domain-containing protein n=1 Tax=Geofilum rubicundum JCM 15548 TaxID=1236989 RepID=A0A0E9LZW7_9BACT|nr:heavy metal-associated domain-containing protein [Geofilum rubicundum]GAO30395.1 hypothetical protein JCM15548_12660 [Geofilum rubicundum JCM 15548]